MRMRVAETFVSLQGEGVLAGVPSFFIRTSGCNLRCSWCDTPYASWRPEGSQVEVGELVAQAAAAGVRHVVVTGGEPLVQPEIGSLTAALAKRHHVTVETAGTLAPALTCHLLSVSPKTSSSDPTDTPAWLARHRRARSELGPLRLLLARHPEYQLKLVIREESDIDEVHALIEAVGAAAERVLLMPEGRTAAEVAARAPEVARLALRHGFRYTPRLHLDLFGDGRGV